MALPGPSETPQSAVPMATPGELVPARTPQAAPSPAPASDPAPELLETPGPVPLPLLDFDPPLLREFRIGYLPQEGRGGLSEALARRLGAWLETNLKVRRALRDAGFAGEIAVQSADGHNDLRNGLNSRQFELAFAPATVYATLDPNYYAVILQEKHEGDIWDARAGGQILRKGVVFAGPRSTLFTADEVTSGAMRRALADEEMAVPSAYDAAGYQYPLLALATQMGIQPRSVSLRFCGSSEEVVKQVVSGLASVGACDQAVLENWLPGILPDSLSSSEAVRVLGQINVPLVPSDPVVIQAELSPEESELGRVLKEELPKFFTSLGAGSPFTLESSRDAFYERLLSDLDQLEALTRPGEDPGP